MKMSMKIILFDLLGSLLLGVSVDCFTVSAGFAPGGVTGLAVMGNHLFHIPVGWLTLLINVPIILCTFRKLGGKFFLMSMKTMLLSSLFIDYVAVLFPVFAGSRLLSCLLAGVTGGAGYALIYAEDSSTGGTDFIIMAVKRTHPAMSFGRITLCVDGVICLLSLFVFGNAEAVLYGLLYTAAVSLTLDAGTRLLEKTEQTRMAQ